MPSTDQTFSTAPKQPKRPLIVQKYGGTSLGTTEKLGKGKGEGYVGERYNERDCERDEEKGVSLVLAKKKRKSLKYICLS